MPSIYNLPDPSRSMKAPHIGDAETDTRTLREMLTAGPRYATEVYQQLPANADQGYNPLAGIQTLETPDSYGGAIFRTIASSFQQAGLGLGSTFSRLTGDSETADEMLSASDLLEQRYAEQDPSYLSRMSRGAGRSAVQATNYGLGGANAIYAGFGLETYNRGLKTAADAGLDGAERQIYAVTQGVVEAGLSKLIGAGMTRMTGAAQAEAVAAGTGILASSVRELAKKVGITVLQEIPEEIAVEVAQGAVDRISGVDPQALQFHTEDGSFLIDSDGNLSPGMEMLRDTVVQTSLSVGAMSAPAAGVSLYEQSQRARQAREQAELPPLPPPPQTTAQPAPADERPPAQPVQLPPQAAEPPAQAPDISGSSVFSQAPAGLPDTIIAPENAPTIIPSAPAGTGQDFSDSSVFQEGEPATDIGPQAAESTAPVPQPAESEIQPADLTRIEKPADSTEITPGNEQKNRVLTQARKAFGEDADAVVALMSAHAELWGRANGKSADEWFQRIEGVKRRDGETPKPADPNRPNATVRGRTIFRKNGRALIKAFKSADVYTFAHEAGHVFRRSLGEVDTQLLQQAEEAIGVKKGKWSRANEEAFARGFEKYLSTGQAPTRGLAKVFEQFKAWASSLYNAVRGRSKIDVSPELAAVFDTMLGKREGTDSTRDYRIRRFSRQRKMKSMERLKAEAAEYGIRPARSKAETAQRLAEIDADLQAAAVKHGVDAKELQQEILADIAYQKEINAEYDNQMNQVLNDLGLVGRARTIQAFDRKWEDPDFLGFDELAEAQRRRFSDEGIDFQYARQGYSELPGDSDELFQAIREFLTRREESTDSGIYSEASLEAAAERLIEQKDAEAVSFNPADFGDDDWQGAFTGLPAKPGPKAGKRARQLREQSEPYKSPFAHHDPEKERRIVTSPTRGVQTWPEFLRNLAVTAWQGLTRPQMNLPNTAENALPNEFFRLLKLTPSVASDEAARMAADVVDDLNAIQLDLFDRYVQFVNMAHGVTQNGDARRYGFETAEEVTDYLGFLQSHVDTDPTVQAAWQKRQKIKREFVATLIDNKLMNDLSEADIEAYAHQAVLWYRRQPEAKTGGGAVPQAIKRSPQKRRVKREELDEKYDPTIGYIEAEMIWMTEMGIELKKKQLVDDYLRPLDQMPAMKQRAKDDNFRLLVGGEENVKRIEYLRGQIAESRELGGNDSAERQARKMLIEELAELDPTYPYRMEIAKAVNAFEAEIKRAIGEGEIREAPALFEKMKPLDPDSIPMDEVDDWLSGDIFAAINWVQEHAPDSDARKWGDKIFKEIQARNKMIQDELGDRFRTWKDLLHENEKLAVWQPQPGNLWYKAFSVPERLIEDLQRGVTESVEVKASDLQQIMAIGGRRPEMVLPADVVRELDKQDKPPMLNIVQKLFRGAMSLWKSQVLFAFKRAAGYMSRNLTGDLQVMLAGAPGSVWRINEAGRELAEYMKGDKLHLSENLETALRLGVPESGHAAQEIPDPAKMRLFKRFFVRNSQTGGVKNAVKQLRAGKVIGAYAEISRGIRDLAAWRESTFRYAAYLYYLDLLNTGKLQHYGSSKREVIDAIHKERGPEVAAAKLARELLGDYGNRTAFGNWLRRHLVPFWAFTEINLQRYPRMAINAWQAGQKKRAAGTAAMGATVLSVGYTLRLAAMYGALWAWNHAPWNIDEEEDLSQYDQDKMHINLGRKPDGTVRIFRNPETLGEFLEFFGLGTFFANIGEVANGRMTAGELAVEMGKDAFNHKASMLRPDIKALFEIGAGITLFPDALNPRPYPRDEKAAELVVLGDEYRYLRGQLLKDGTTARPHYWDKYFGLAYSDPRRNARNRILGLRQRFLAKEGSSRQGGGRSKMHNIMEAVMANDRAAFNDARRKYLEDGNSYSGFVKSLNATDPLNGIRAELEPKFIDEFLNDDERKDLRVAREYMAEIADTAFTWFRDEMATDPPELREANEAAFAKQATGHLRVLARRQPTRKGLSAELYQAKLDDWRRAKDEAVDWLKEQGVTRGDASRLYSPASSAGRVILRRELSRLEK